MIPPDNSPAVLQARYPLDDLDALALLPNAQGGRGDEAELTRLSTLLAAGPWEGARSRFEELRAANAPLEAPEVLYQDADLIITGHVRDGAALFAAWRHPSEGSGPN